MKALAVDKCVLIDPPQAAGIRTECHESIGWQLGAHSVDLVEDALPDRLTLRIVGQDDVDEGIAQVGGRADGPDTLGTHQFANQGFGHFRLQKLGTSGPLGVDDDLGVGNVGDRIKRCGTCGIDAEDDSGRNERQHEASETDDVSNYCGQHHPSCLL